MSHYGATARFLLIQFLHILDYSSHHFPEQTELIYISRGGGGKVAKALKKKKKKRRRGPHNLFRRSGENSSYDSDSNPRCPFSRRPTTVCGTASPHPHLRPVITKEVGGGHCPRRVCCWSENFPASPPSRSLGPSASTKRSQGGGWAKLEERSDGVTSQPAGGVGGALL